MLLVPKVFSSFFLSSLGRRRQNVKGGFIMAKSKCLSGIIWSFLFSSVLVMSSKELAENKFIFSIAVPLI